MCSIMMETAHLSSRWTGDSAQSTRTSFLIVLTVTVPVTPGWPFSVHKGFCICHLVHVCSCQPTGPVGAGVTTVPQIQTPIDRAEG